MRRCRILVTACLVLFGLALDAAAQTGSPSEPQESPAIIDIAALSPDQDLELTKWLTAMDKWQQYDARWRNRPVHDGWARIVDRQPPPAAPGWLEERCAVLTAAHFLDLDARVASACRMLDDPRVASAARAARPDPEKPPKHTSFLTRVHLDGLWVTTPNGARMYGIIGTHVSLVDVGRLQVFGPPGVMLLTVPDGYGGRRVTFGYTWGLSVRLFDVKMASPTKNMTLFINVSKVWLGTGESGAQNPRGYDIAGFSIAPRKKR